MASTQTREISKVFIDSSVLIAAAISAKGSARDLLLRGFRGLLELWTSPDVLVESERNLATKAPTALASFFAFQKVLAAASVVALKDAPIVAAAALAKADYLATYDRKHLLNHKEQIKSHFDVVVVVPEDVLVHLEE